MEFSGCFKGIQTDYLTGETVISFTINERSALGEVDKIKDIEKLRINAVEYKDIRSGNANRLMWHCLGKIAAAHTPPLNKWQLYKDKLKEYGKYTYICVKPHVVDAMKAVWRECEVIGNIDINGKEAVQMLCYFGSSTFDTKEFSVFLDGIIQDMKDLGLQPPLPEDMRHALEQWEKMQKGKNDNEQ